ncbi:MAG TPA: type 1 glutamine amidotransferase [Spirochaetia bacterium]|nr:type 1 glutamine amidotransferase [Spirochaetia bacterium]
MRVHYFQHVPFEGLGSMKGWLEGRSAQVTSTRFFEDSRLPPVADIDWLIILGGPMSVNDEKTCPWLSREKAFIEEAAAREKVVLGICLGAQLIARAMGARVYANHQPEIGWFPIERTGEPGVPALPARLDVFHWHGETFDLPSGARGIARSDGCESQAFVMGDRVVGFQFHLETTPTAARAMTAACGDELVPGRFIQTEEQILSFAERFDRINAVMAGVLDALSEVPSH